MTITEAIRDWLEGFPGLSGGAMHIDWLPAEAQTYSVDSVPAEPVLQQYMDGGSLRQHLFTVASKMFYGPDVADQAENMAWFEDFTAWVEAQSFRRRLPDLGAGRRCKTIEIVSTAYPYTVSEDGCARYQVQMKMTYQQEGNL
jgi:hypothetical protein